MTGATPETGVAPIIGFSEAIDSAVASEVHGARTRQATKLVCAASERRIDAEAFLADEFAPPFEVIVIIILAAGGSA